MTIMKKFALPAFVAACIAAPCFATDYKWAGGGSPTNWDHQNRWINQTTMTNNGFPGSGDKAIFEAAAQITSGVPSSLSAIEINVNTVSVSLSVGSPVQLAVGTVALNTGSLTLGSNLEVKVSTAASIASSKTMTIGSGSKLIVDAISLSNNGTFQINAGGVAEFEDDADITGTGTFNQNGEVRATGVGTMNIPSSQTLSDSASPRSVYRVEGSGTCRMQLNDDLPFLNGHFELASSSNDKFVIASGFTVETTGGYYTPYGTPCNGIVTSSSTFAWSNDDNDDESVEAGACPQ